MPSKKTRKSKRVASINQAEEDELLNESLTTASSGGKNVSEEQLLDSTPTPKQGKRKKEKSVSELDISLASEIVFEDSATEPVSKPEEPARMKKKKAKMVDEKKKDKTPVKKSPLKGSPVKSPIKTPSKLTLEDIPTTPTKNTGLSTPEITPEKASSPTTPKYASDVEEVDIYGEIPPTTVEAVTPEGEVTLDEVLKSTNKEKEEQKEKDKLLSDNEEEDLDYEPDDQKEGVTPVQKISVVVRGGSNKSDPSTEKSPTKKSPREKKQQGISLPPTLPPPPLILPALPQIHISIPPMLPLPPNPPTRGRLVYINPKFKTEVIVRNLEEQGVLKGGSVAIHMNRRVHKRSRSRSPIKLAGKYEYIPSDLSKLSDPATTLLVTDLSSHTSKTRIRELFSSAGSVREVLTFPSERRAVVTFGSAKDAVTCRRKFHKSEVDGSCVTVNFAL